MKVMLPKKNKRNVIILSILAFVFLASGIFLLWRVNQPETVAPEKGEAGETYECNRCSANYIYARAKWNKPNGIPQSEIDEKCGGTLDCQCAIDHFWEETSEQMGGIYYECDPSCTDGGVGTQWVGYQDCIADMDIEPDLGYHCARCSFNFNYAYARWNVPEAYKGLCDQAATEGIWANNNISGAKPTYSCDCSCTVEQETGTLSAMGDWIDSTRTYSECQEYCKNLQQSPTTYILTYVAGTGGYLLGDTVQYIEAGGSGTPVTAVPHSNYRFNTWNYPDFTANPRIDTNVTSRKNIRAIFTKIDTNVTTTCGDGACTGDENAVTCPKDCNSVCGDGACTGDENANMCSKDCPADCGDNYCNPETETATNCSTDCFSVCGDGACTHSETSVDCPEDCGPVSSSRVPATGIFDNSQGSLILGFVLLILGFTWRIIGNNTLLLVNNALDLKKKTSKERELKRSRERKKNFERKVVKD